MCFLKPVTTPPQPITTGPTIAFDVRATSDLITMIHAVLKDSVSRVQENPAMLTCGRHFL